MGKGTPAMGRKSGKKNMIFCRRCGKRTFHLRKKKCSSCRYGAASKMRRYNWRKRKNL
ncbi:TPA: 50S ribosomal protein L37e [Candidatus Woesearchaeota archaeon]|nr:50S ribosomal protein L37e [Candidatus Woesearchaeota archaeon]HIH91986.1 50S ribosomal protein L37e [Candidatus Woesearchaeota archaeon]HII64582.1 50S ribosomal protein L37e [Candidatus Woesearchaeota archaeon]HII66189.1 50S ribosomal protein L37e [Candidatus Woesearchaeota archaeon]HIJ18154.1 50S ribosomal protein L37e [Candidatus Woesearchaeota archaeon]